MNDISAIKPELDMLSKIIVDTVPAEQSRGRELKFMDRVVNNTAKTGEATIK